jgi:hypothetical protein
MSIIHHHQSVDYQTLFNHLSEKENNFVTLCKSTQELIF